MSSNIEAIRAAEAQIPPLQLQLEALRAEAMLDGEISEQEQAGMDVVEDKITSLRDLILEKRALWEANKEAYEKLRSEIDTAFDPISPCDNSLLEPDYREVENIQQAVEAEVAQENFAGAIEQGHRLSDAVTRLLGKREELDQARQDYEKLRADIDKRIADFAPGDFYDIRDELTEVEDAIAEIDALAAALDWPQAKEKTTAIRLIVDSYKIGSRQQEMLHEELTKAVAGFRTDLAPHESSDASVKRGVDDNLSRIEEALAGAASLKEAKTLLPVITQQIVELGHLKEAMDKLAAAAPDDLDDVSRAIVEDLKKKGQLDQLPTELRSTLVENLMEGDPTPEEQEAMQDIFSDPHIDRQFEAVDSATRQSIVDALLSDPEVQKIAEDWEKMSGRKRIEAVKKLVEFPAGDEGWNVGAPNVEKDNTSRKKGGTAGGYVHSTDTLTFNVHDDACANFEDALATIAHEVGHKYQRELIERMDPSHPQALSPGDPEYEQARWLAAEDLFFKKYNDPENDDDPFDKIYWTSPSETHSREMGDEIREGLEGGFDVPEDEDEGR